MEDFEMTTFKSCCLKQLKLFQIENLVMVTF